MILGAIVGGTKYDLKLGPICKIGFAPITTSWVDCKRAAVALGFVGDNVCCVDYDAAALHGTDSPEGCFQSTSNNRFHFNKGKGGKAHGTEKILCKRIEQSAFVTICLLIFNPNFIRYWKGTIAF